MIRPASFGYNSETAKNNAFQKKKKRLGSSDIQKRAIIEFDNAVKKIKKAKIKVIVATDSKKPKKPDAIFPNNWLSTHQDGVLVTYPMFSNKRRAERDPAILKKLEKKFVIQKEIKFEAFENAGLFLEGTGSMVLDRENKIAYACQCERTDPDLFKQFCTSMGYKSCLFKAVDKANKPIYHTNVMLSVGVDFVMICWDTIKGKKDRKRLKKHFKKTGKRVVEISYKQMLSFACNSIQLKNKKGKRILLMSSAAFSSLKKKQLRILKAKTRILHCPIEVIEHYGGGSLRCMVAEIFLAEK